MRNKVRESMKVMLSIILLFSFSCIVYGQTQSLSSEEPKKYSPSAEIRANLVRVGVVSASFQPRVSWVKPITKGTAALSGAEEGFFGTLGAGGAAGPYGAAAATIVAPFATIIKAGGGVVSGASAGKLKEAEDTLNGYLASLDFQGTLRDSLMSAAREQTQYSFVSLDLQGLSTPGEDATYDVSSYHDIDIVLEIGIDSCRLSTRHPEDINPDLYLHVDGRIRFLSAKDGKVLRSTYISYPSYTHHKLQDWGADNARLFKKEMDRAFQSLADQIVGFLPEGTPPLSMGHSISHGIVSNVPDSCRSFTNLPQSLVLANTVYTTEFIYMGQGEKI